MWCCEKYGVKMLYAWNPNINNILSHGIEHLKIKIFITHWKNKSKQYDGMLQYHFCWTSTKH